MVLNLLAFQSSATDFSTEAGSANAVTSNGDWHFASNVLTVWNHPANAQAIITVTGAASADAGVIDHATDGYLAIDVA